MSYVEMKLFLNILYVICSGLYSGRRSLVSENEGLFFRRFRVEVFFFTVVGERKF